MKRLPTLFAGLAAFASILIIHPIPSDAAPPARVSFVAGHTTSCVNNLPRVVLSWNNPNGATSFVVHRNPTTSGVQSWASLATTAALSYTDASASLKPGTFQYQIQAVSTTGSRYSNIVSVTVPNCAAPVTAARPTLSATAQCTSAGPEIRLSWDNPNGATSFTMHRNPALSGNAVWVQLATGISGTQYADTKVLPGVSHQYQLQTSGGSAASQYTNIVSIVPPNCAVTPTPPPATTTPPKVLKWGAYSGWQSSAMQEFETRIGKNPNHMAAFVHWANNQFPTYMEPFTKAKGRTLIIFWEPSDYLVGGTVQPDFSADAILAGRWDTYIRNFASSSRAYGAPIILIPFSEMNGNWNPWSGTTNGNTPAKVVAAYRHVRTVFGNVPNVKFGWAPNAPSVPNTVENAIEAYYPGDAYVDIVGIDGFNFGTPAWLTFDQVFNKALATISKYNKPIYVFSFASAAGPQKAAWITDALTVQMQRWPLIEGWVWFNQNKEQNWLVWSDEASLTAFRNALP